MIEPIKDTILFNKDCGVEVQIYMLYKKQNEIIKWCNEHEKREEDTKESWMTHIDNNFYELNEKIDRLNYS